MSAQPQILTRNEIYDGVRDVLIEELAVEYQDVTPEARLVKDLVTDSIGNLSIIFRLEKRFGMKIPAEGLFPVTYFSVDAPEYLLVDRTFYTPEKIEELKRAHPHIDLKNFTNAPSLKNLLESITVSSIVDYLEQHLGAKRC